MHIGIYLGLAVLFAGGMYLIISGLKKKKPTT
jgi:hypothetical protein